MFYDITKEDQTNYNIQLGFIVFDIVTFLALFFFPAQYGRLKNSNRTSFMMPSKYGWILEEIPNLLITLYYTCLYSTPKSTVGVINYLVLSMFFIHYIHRTLIFPFSIVNSKNMPLEIMLLGATFTTFNSIMICRSVLFFADYNWDYIVSFRFMLGLALFILGMYINIYHDYSVISQRKGKDGYIVPKGGLFEYISCPNYFGEIVEWLGFAIASGTFSGLVFGISTFSNLFPRALEYHKWYHNKFGEGYPKGRKAIIPFII
jgi:protein-S-isoprenylcysteine O-methyltransferase Ste14